MISFDNSGIATFTQGQDPTCVAASTVMARLTADPVLMLAVTTGQGPASAAVSGSGAKPGDESQAAVAARAQTLFNQDYAYGRAAQGDDAKKFLGITYQAAAPPGLGSTGVIAVADQQLTPVTGSAYRYQPLTDTAEPPSGGAQDRSRGRRRRTCARRRAILVGRRRASDGH